MIVPVTPWIKLFAIALVAWAALGSTAGGGSGTIVVVVLLVLLALLDAAGGRQGGDEKRRLGYGETLRQGVSLLRGLVSLSVWPFYGALALLAAAALSGRSNRTESAGLAASRGWPVAEPAVANHAPGATGLCACGKQLGHDKTAAQSPAEAAKRTEAIKKRTMNPTPKGIPTASLPGIGPNAKPLAPGLVPNAAAKLPPSAQKLLEASGQPSVPQANPPPSPSAVGPAEPRANLTPAPAPASSAPLFPTPQPSSSVPSKLTQPPGSPT